VATVGIDGAQNAAILAAQIIATADKVLAQRLNEFKDGLKKKIVKANEDLKEVKYKYKTN
jgi:5-(carboxyamino)imidazole ribonucleotide mutase